MRSAALADERGTGVILLFIAKHISGQKAKFLAAHSWALVVQAD
jgi:hypothetical protein